jgi:hypothetical protein
MLVALSFALAAELLTFAYPATGKPTVATGRLEVLGKRIASV